MAVLIFFGSKVQPTPPALAAEDFLLGTKWYFGGNCAAHLVFGTLAKVFICSSHLSRQLWGWGIAVPGYWCPNASCWVDLQWYEVHFIIHGGLAWGFFALAVEVFFSASLVKMKFLLSSVSDGCHWPAVSCILGCCSELRIAFCVGQLYYRNAIRSIHHF